MLFIWFPRTNLSWVEQNPTAAWFQCGWPKLFSALRTASPARIGTCSVTCAPIWMSSWKRSPHISVFLVQDLKIPRKQISIFPNNKPWVSKSLKNIINQRNIAFNQGNITRSRELQKQVRREIKLAKVSYKHKVQSLLSTGNSRPAREGVKFIMGMHSKKSSISFAGKSDYELVNDLNIFYNCLNNYDFSEEMSAYRNAPPFEITVKFSVFKLFRGVKEGKNPGSDKVSGRILNNCTGQLAEIFSSIFNKSLHLQRVPHLWKDSIIVPVPKIKTPKSLNDFWPIALTSLVMKVFEKTVKNKILGIIQGELDPLKFAYRAGRGVEDAVGTFLHTVLGHLEGENNFVLLLFIDFCSAFNSIQPHILADWLTSTHIIDPGFIC